MLLKVHEKFTSIGKRTTYNTLSGNWVSLSPTQTDNLLLMEQGFPFVRGLFRYIHINHMAYAGILGYLHPKLNSWPPSGQSAFRTSSKHPKGRSEAACWYVTHFLHQGGRQPYLGSTIQFRGPACVIPSKAFLKRAKQLKHANSGCMICNDSLPSNFHVEGFLLVVMWLPKTFTLCFFPGERLMWSA